jgi:lipopolysaccharide export system protein LptA
LVVWLPAAFALPTDREQAITIQSDRALRDEKTGLTVYAGNVKITQGTLHIRADNITLFNDKRGLYKVIAEGNPAHYQQQPSADKPLIEAEGKTIEYHADVQLLHLIENASLNQDGTLMQGQRIDYDIQKQVVTASGELDTTKQAKSDQKPGQIVIVIPPNTIANAEKKSASRQSEPNNEENTKDSVKAPKIKAAQPIRSKLKQPRGKNKSRANQAANLNKPA